CDSATAAGCAEATGAGAGCCAKPAALIISRSSKFQNRIKHTSGAARILIFSEHSVQREVAAQASATSLERYSFVLRRLRLAATTLPQWSWPGAQSAAQARSQAS